MAATATGRRLTEQHRLAQLAITVATIRELRKVWPLLDPGNLVASTDRWVTAALRVITAQFATSQEVAVRYFQAFRLAEIGRTFQGSIPRAAIRPKAVATSLIVSGPIRLRRATETTLPQVRRVAETEMARAGSRHAVNGGRELVRQASLADGRARGWGRITSGKACKFCSMLAGRGAVYSEASVDFQAHDGCHCQAEPAY